MNQNPSDCEFDHGDARFRLVREETDTSVYHVYCVKQGASSLVATLSENKVLVADPEYAVLYCLTKDFTPWQGLLIVYNFLYIQFELNLDGGVQFIAADIETKKVITQSDVVREEEDSNPCEERRDTPCWKTLHAPNGSLVYEGFCMEDTCVCYGTYYNKNEGVRYKGGLVNGEFWGPGEHFDMRGNLIYSGEWIWNRRYRESVRINTVYNPIRIHQAIKEISVANNSGNAQSLTVLDFSGFKLLESLLVEYCCFKYGKTVRLTNLPHLKEVIFGEYTCFGTSPNRQGTKEFHVVNCPALESLRIYPMSFYSFTCCELRGVLRAPS